jgi:hypothetical protein
LGDNSGSGSSYEGRVDGDEGRMRFVNGQEEVNIKVNEG